MSGTTSHGTTTDSQGRPLLLQDSRLAADNFGLNGLHFLAVPKAKYMFYVRFLRVGTSSSGINGTVNISSDITSGQNTSSDIGFVVKSMDRPKVSFDTEIINQYNKKRIVQKRVEYGPINMKFHDTIDNQVYRMFQSYFEHYYADSQHDLTTDWSNDVIAGKIRSSEIGWGFIGSSLTADLSSYFSQIEVYQVFSGYYNQFNLINPKIQSFAPDELDYGASGVTHEISMTLDFEGINFIVNGAKLSSNTSLISLMKLDQSDFYEPESGSISSTVFNTDGSSNILNNLNSNTILSNTLSSTATQIGQTASTGQGLNIGGALQGSFNTASSNAVSNSYSSVLGNLGNSTTYNILNSGISNFSANSQSSPALRGLSLLI